MKTDKDQYLEVFAEVVESYGKKLSPSEMIRVFRDVFEEHGIQLETRIECDIEEDLDKPLVES